MSVRLGSWGPIALGLLLTLSGISSAASPQGGVESAESPLKSWGDIDFSAYHTGVDTAAILQNKSTKYPTITKLVSIGKTWQGRDIWALKISDNAATEEKDEPEVYINAQHHAREWMTSEVVLYMVDFLTSQYPTDPRAKFLVENRQMWFVPLVNYDGRVRDSASNDPTSYYKQCSGDTGGAGWRKNMRDNDNSGGFNCGDGVDMNRNYAFDFGGSGSSGDPNSQTYRGPSAFSEPETQAIRDNLIGQHWFRNSITYHSYQQALLYVRTSSTDSFATPYAQQIADRITNKAGSQQNGYSMSPGSGGSGQEQGGEFNLFHTVSMLIEVYPTSSDSLPAGHNGFHPPANKILPVAEDNFGGMLVALQHSANPYYMANYADDRGVWGIYPFTRLAGNYTGDTFTIEAAVENYGTSASQPDVRLQIFKDPTGANQKIHEETKKASRQLSRNETDFVPFSFTFTENATYRAVASTVGADDQAWNDAQNSTFKLTIGGGKQPPKVLSNAPADNQTNVPVGAKVTVTFSKPMDSPATEGAFSISPQVAGTFAWPAASMLEFTPSAPLAYSTSYQATISTAAKDVDGLNLPVAHSFTFTTEGPPAGPQVVSTVPPDGATSVPASTTIQVTFSKDMDPPSVGTAFSVSPAVTATMSGSGRTFIWTPGQSLAKGVKHAVTIAGTAQDAQGVAMGADFKFSFTTESPPPPVPPKVLKVTPADATKDWPGSKGVAIEFSAEMDHTTTEAAFSLSPATPGTLSWDAGSRTLAFAPAAALQKGATYLVRVDATAQDRVGTPMGTEFVSAFEAGVPPLVASTAPSADADDIGTSTAITLHFSEPMDRTSVEPALSVEPSFEFDISWDVMGSSVTLMPKTPLAAGTVHKVILTTQASDVAGNAMEKEFVLSFRTAGPTTGEAPGGLPLLTFVMILAAAAILFGLIAILALRRRKRRSTASKAPFAPTQPPAGPPG